MRRSKVDLTRDTILKEIKIGNYPREFALPSERNMADSLGVSYMTLRKAIGQLVEEKYLERRPNIGTFVCSEIPEEKVRKILGIVIPAWAAPEITDLIMHVTEAAERCNWQTRPLFARSWQDRAIIQLYDECNAIVSISVQDVAEMPDRLRERFLSGAKPVVFCDRIEGLALDSVFCDPGRQLIAACDRLYELGHRRFARVDQLEIVQLQPQVMHPGLDSALREFAGKHRDLVMDWNALLGEVQRFELVHEVIFRKIQRYSASHFPFSVIVCPLCYYLGLAAGLARLGLKIGSDVSILCTGDRMEAEYYLPRPTRISSRHREKAVQVMRMVIERERFPEKPVERCEIEPVYLAGETVSGNQPQCIQQS